MKLLSRDQFREQTLARNNGLCCVPSCEEKAVDAHHILNRNLFIGEDEFGGYFLENGAQLCNSHHYDAELTLISVDELREYCNVTPAIPELLEAKETYDCWGNQILSGGNRAKGPLFLDEGCQKALKKANLLWRFMY